MSELVSEPEGNYPPIFKYFIFLMIISLKVGAYVITQEGNLTFGRKIGQGSKKCNRDLIVE
jgi:hypothetical protein